MAATPVVNSLIEITFGGVPVQLCATSINFTSNFDTVDVTTLCDSEKREVATNRNIEFTFDFIVEDSTASAAQAGLRLAHDDANKATVNSYFPVDFYPLGNLPGKFLIALASMSCTQLDISIATNEVVRGSATFKNDGAVVLTDPLP